MIPENDWYGHKRAFAEYCRVPPDTPFLALIAHGWAPDLLPGVGHRTLRFAPFLVWNTHLRDQARASGVPNVHCVGAPFAYLLRSRFPELSAGQGTLVFPAHSAEGLIEYPVEEFIDEVRAAMPAPYTVSVYVQDQGTAAVEAYRRAGFRLVSFGSRMEPDFLVNLAEEIGRHEAVVSNVVQTSIWYGGLMGRTIRVIGRGAYPVEPGQEPAAARPRWPALWEPGVDPAETQRLSEIELGVDRMLDPAGLRAALGLSSWWKRRAASLIRGAIDVRLARQTRDQGFVIDGLDGGRSTR